jgi:hypothetical protein
MKRELTIGLPGIFIILLCTLTSAAQQPMTGKTPDAPAANPAGAVSGHVYLNDTKAPARKATVYLQPAASLLEDTPNDQGHGQGNGAVTMSVQTRFDGSFFFSHVPAGTYYVIASCPGYVSPYAALSLAEARSGYGAWQPLGPSQAAAKELVLKTIPRLTVGSNLAATVDVPLERGGAVSGTITYDDGGPAAGLEVNVLARMLQDGKETWAPFNFSVNPMLTPFHTDDRGNYRVSGLPARKYVVQVTLDLSTNITYISSHGGSTSASGSRFDILPIYSGSTPRLKDATSFAVDLGEERAGEDLRIPISKLHTITGNIVSAHDGHVINGGQVQLEFADDHSVAGVGNSSEQDPSFTLNFIFDGEYILTSAASYDVDYELLPDPGGNVSPPQYTGHPRHFYGSASQPLHVDRDMDGVTIAVPEPTAKEAQAFREMLQQQEQQNQPQPPGPR